MFSSRSESEKARSLVEKGDFLEIYCAADLKMCEERDTKGLYAKARSGEIKDFTGISSPYEEPKNPELKIDTGMKDLDACVEIVISKLVSLNIIPES